MAFNKEVLWLTGGVFVNVLTFTDLLPVIGSTAHPLSFLFCSPEAASSRLQYRYGYRQNIRAYRNPF